MLPVIIEKDPDTKTIIVSFPDIPFAHSVGNNEVEVALVTAFEIYNDKNYQSCNGTINERIRQAQTTYSNFC